MQDNPISQLNELTSPAPNDLVPIVDVSDPTQSVSGTTKHVLFSNLGGGGGGGAGALELVSSGSFTNDTSITGLDGNTDGVYQMCIETNAAYGYQVTIRFNNDDINARYKDIYEYATFNGSNTSYNSPTGRNSGNGGFTLPIGHNYQRIKMFLYARTGAPRMYKVEYVAYSNNPTMAEMTLNGFYTETDTNLTSIQIIQGEIASGVYQLYKYQQS